MDAVPGALGAAFFMAASGWDKRAEAGIPARFLVCPAPCDVMIPAVPEAKILLPPN